MDIQQIGKLPDDFPMLYLINKLESLDGRYYLINMKIYCKKDAPIANDPVPDKP